MAGGRGTVRMHAAGRRGEVGISAASGGGAVSGSSAPARPGMAPGSLPPGCWGNCWPVRPSSAASSSSRRMIPSSAVPRAVSRSASRRRGLRLCQEHRRWDQPARAIRRCAGRAWHGHAALPSCRVPGCGFGAMRHRLCPRHDGAWRRAGEPGLDGWLAASARPAAAGAGSLPGRPVPAVGGARRRCAIRTCGAGGGAAARTWRDSPGAAGSPRPPGNGRT